MKDLALKGRPLMLFGLAGAAVMQLDKVIVSAFLSPAAMAPYYLASLLCLTPLSTLAGPLAQLFQPGVVHAQSAADDARLGVQLRRFVTAIGWVTAVPTAALWWLREPTIAVWLGASDQARLVAQYTAILLPGVAIGALGYVPYVFLVGRQDYRFQARLSAAFTVITLSAVASMAWAKRVDGVCLVYTLYHTASTVASWTRCIRMEHGAARCAIVEAAWRASGIVLITVLVTAIPALVSHNV